MKSFPSRLGIVIASLTLAAGPAFAQKPAEGGAADRAAGSNASSSSGGAVDRGGGGAGGNSGFSSPSAGAATSPSISFGDRAVREFAPQHRGGFRDNATAYSDDGQKAASRSSGPSGGGSNGGAVSRGTGSSSGSSGAAGTRAEAGSSDGGSGRTPSRTRTGSPDASTTVNNASGTREVPTWARPRGDRPVTGQAVERTVPPPSDHGHYNGGNGYYDGFGYYNPYGYYGYGYSPYAAYYYPYGFGMGYGLYSGFGWAPYYGDPFGDPYGYAAGGGGGYFGGSSSSYGRGEQGSLKLKVKPHAAKVYVDGYFVGPVDQFDGAFQKLALNTGRHKVEIKADGFETAEFDVLINPEQTVTFQGELKRIQ